MWGQEVAFDETAQHPEGSHEAHILPEAGHEPGDDGHEAVSQLVAKLEPILRAGDEGNWRDMVCVRKLAALKERLLEERQREQHQHEANAVGDERYPAAEPHGQAQALHTVNAALEKINRRFEYMRQQGHSWMLGARVSMPEPKPWHDVWHAPPAEAAYSTSASSKVRVLRRNNSTLRLALAGSLFIDRLDVEGPQGRHSPAGEGVRDAVLYEYMDAAEFRKRQLLEMERARQSRELHLSDDVPIPEATSVSEDEDRDDQEYDRETTCSQAAGEEQVSDRTSVSGSSVAARVAPSPWTSLPPGAGLPVAPTIPRVFASNEDEYREQLLAASLLTSLDRRRSSGSRGYGRPANSIRSDSTSHTNESAEETRRTSAIISQSPPSESTEKVHPSTAHGHVSGVSSGSSAHSMPSATVQELSGSGRYRPGSNAAPSRFCHVCARTKDLQTCANLSSGCRKVTCAKCFEDHHWTRSDAWICTHCRGVCPERSQCQIYRLSNRNRNAKGRRGTHSGQGSGVGSGPRRKRGRLV